METRDPVAQQTERESGRRAAWLVLALSLALAGCANLGSPPAELGGMDPYRVRGRTYVPLQKWESYEEIGVASWYGGKFHGRTTASGERFNTHGALTAAHRTLPFNVCAEVENLGTGRSVVVRINDRFPNHKGRIIDLSRAAAREIGLIPEGSGRVRLEVVG